MADREKVIAALGNALVQMHGCGRYTPEDVDELETAAWGALKLLEEQESVVVRCKDCKYCVKEPNGELFCDILAVGYEPLGSKKVNEDWFCADGERR